MLATIPALFPCVVLGHSSGLSSLIVPTAWSYTVFYVGLLLFVVRYRLSSNHPLAQYPGPTILKITKLWGAWIAYKGKTNIYLKELHDKYGPTIRIGESFIKIRDGTELQRIWSGPNELSTVEKDLIPLILGNRGMPKGPR